MILGITGSGPVQDAALQTSSGSPPMLNSAKKAFVNIQATPLYTGFPLKRDVTVHYIDGTSTTKKDGGLVESFAFGGDAPSKQNFAAYTPGQAVLVDGLALAKDKTATWSVKRAAGASSAWGDNDLYYLESPPDLSKRTCSWWATWCTVETGGGLLDMVTAYTKFPILGPKTTNWGTGVDKPTNNDIRLSDGDVDGDLLGLIDVIPRNVPASLSFFNPSKALCNKTSWDPSTDITPATLEKCIDSYIPPLFGVASTTGDRWGYPERDTERLHIFANENGEFVKFVQALQQNMEDGKTAAARMTVTTKANRFSGVPGGKKIDWTLFMLSDSKTFRAALPAETQEELDKGDAGQFAHFPHYNTMGQNSPGLNSFSQILNGDQAVKGLTSLTNAQVRLLSGLTSWAVKQNMDLVEPLFNYT